MADTVETAIYKMGVSGQESVQAGAQALDKLAAADEKVTKARRTSIDTLERRLAAVDKAARAERQLANAMQEFNRYNEEGIGTSQQRLQLLQAQTQRYEDQINALARLSGATRAVAAPEGFGLSGKSARDSAAAFEEAAREADQFAAKAAVLRSQIDPLGTAQARYNAELLEYTVLAERGVITTQELAAAQALAGQRLASAEASIKAGGMASTFLGAADAAKLSAFQVQNLSFQMNDMATMLASGQNPFVMMMQQGMQIAQIFGPGVGVAGALKSVGTALVSFVTNPLTLAVIGLAAAAGAVKLFFDLVGGGGKAAEETLKRHDDLLKRIKDRYGEVETAAKRYQASISDLQFDQRSVLKDLGSQLEAQLQDLRGAADRRGFGLGKSLFGIDLGDPFAGDSIPQELIDTADKFFDDIRAGNADVLAFTKSIKEIANTEPTNAALQKLVKNLTDTADKALKSAGGIRELKNSILASMDVAGRLAAWSELAQQDMSNYGKFANEAAVSINRLNEAHVAEISAIGAKSPAQKAAVAAEKERISLIGEEITQEEKSVRIGNAGAQARAEAEHTMSKALRDRIVAMGESVAAAELEIAVVGRSIGEASRLRTEFQLLEAAKKAAADSGTVVSPNEVAAIKSAAVAMGELNQALAEKAKLGDLAFERDQIFRSPVDQEVATALRSIYGDGYQAHANEAIAKQIRFNALLTDAKGYAEGFAQSLVSGLMSGESTAQSLATSLTNLSSQLANSAITDLFSGDFVGAAVTGICGRIAPPFAQEEDDQ